jgi:hypothetical protein
MEPDKKIQIIYAPGTFGHLLRWILDRFSPDCRFQHINDPWDENNRVHERHEKKLYNKKFIRSHQVRYDSLSLSVSPDAEKIIITFNKDELLFVERCSFYRNPGNENEQRRYQNIISNSTNTVLSLFDLKQTVNSKMVAKEISKIQLHDHENHSWWNTMLQFISHPNHQHFTIDAFFNNELFVSQLEKVDKRFKLDLQIDKKIIESIVNRINQMYVVQTKNRAQKVLDAIKNKENVDCSQLDILEQAWIEVILEKQHDSLIFPYGTNWFENTDQINEFLDTYPSYLKHMNPRLPWYNNIKNPFYLTGKIDEPK